MSVTLDNLILAADNARNQLNELKASYSKLEEGTGPIGSKAAEVLALLETLHTKYGVKSATLSEKIAAIASEATSAARFSNESESAQALQRVLDKANELKNSIDPDTGSEGDDGTGAEASVAAAAPVVRAAPAVVQREPAKPSKPEPMAQQQGREAPIISQQGQRRQNKQAMANRGGFRYSVKKHRRTPSHKKTHTKRTSSKRKLASLRGGRKRTSRRTSRRTARRTAHKKRRTSHRRRKH
tara:strand:- start:1314 stop:2036 length:723 start_codon:yes stop_codon:yes gene_type:complete